MVRIWVASLHQKSSSVFSALEFFVLLVRETHKCGGIRTAAEPTAACGGNREARLGQRSAFSKPCQGAAEKAASATRKTRRTVRRGKKPLRGFFRCAARVIHPRPPKNRNVSKYAAVFVLRCFALPCCFRFARPSEQLCQNAVLHNKPGGGQGEGAAIKGGIPGADAVLHKGQLRGGKLLAVQGFVGFEVKPLAQPQL